MKEIKMYQCEICNEVYFKKRDARKCNARFEWKDGEYLVGMMYRVTERRSGDFVGIAGLCKRQKVDGHKGNLGFALAVMENGRVEFKQVFSDRIEARGAVHILWDFNAIIGEDFGKPEFEAVYEHFKSVGEMPLAFIEGNVVKLTNKKQLN